MTFTLSTPIGRIAAAKPGGIAVLERNGLEYCCGGKQSLAEACKRRGLDPQRVLAEILEIAQTAEGNAAEAINWDERPLRELVEHLEQTHHAYLNENMPRLSELAQTVAQVHGEHHRELAEVRRVFAKFVFEMGPHLQKEEQMLFPSILRLEASFPIWQPIAVMEAEHDEASRDLATLRELTGGYRVPEDACTSYRMLLKGLAEMESDTLMHLHKENNILFPRALEGLAVK